jgi:hypothetical protein
MILEAVHRSPGICITAEETSPPLSEASGIDKRLTTSHEITHSIPGTSTILNVYWVWNEVHPASRGKLVSYLIEK